MLQEIGLSLALLDSQITKNVDLLGVGQQGISIVLVFIIIG